MTADAKQITILTRMVILHVIQTVITILPRLQIVDLIQIAKWNVEVNHHVDAVQNAMRILVYIMTL